MTEDTHSKNKLLDFFRLIRKDTDVPGLSLDEQKQVWKQIEKKNRQYDRRYMRRFIYGSVAASICILIVVGGYYSTSQPVVETDYIALLDEMDPKTVNSDKVQLVLPDNRKIDIDGEQTKVDYNSGNGQININSKEVLEEQPATTEIAYHQLIVPVGKRSTITFSDGTLAWVNSGSRVIYPVCFEGNKREIFADGEIYLEVKENPEKPFIVKTNHASVRVLGTKFGVTAYKDDPEMQVVLVSGKVEVGMQNSPKTAILSPNQMFHYDANVNKAVISHVNAADCIAWKDGYYLFEKQKLSAVLNKLSKYYGICFEWNEEDVNQTCSGKLDLKENVSEVLNALEKAVTIRFEQIGDNRYKIVKP